VQTAQKRAVLRGHTGVVTAIVYSPDGSLLATASKDATVRLWRANTGQAILTLHGHTGQVHSLAFSRDGSRLASASTDGTVRVWALRLDDLIRIAESGATRDLTAEECLQYLHRACSRPGH
jgi:WD40 repeat protein